MSKEESDVAVLQCDCYVHTGSRFVNKIVESAAARRNSLCPLLGSSDVLPQKKVSVSVPRIPHQRIEDEAVVFEEFYKKGHVLGRGSFGVVISAQHRKTGKLFAIKQINKEKAGSAEVKLLEREVMILKKVNHQQIIQLEEVLETSKKMFLVMELCEFGDLKSLLFSKGPFSEESSRFIIKNLADVVAYLHKNGIVHRDLKLDNILISSRTESESGQPLFDIRLTDFGLSVVKDATDHMLQAACGTPVYMAPEVIRNQDYSQQCDTWSIGVILYALLSREFPFLGDTEEKLYEAIKKGEIKFSGGRWGEMTESVKNLIKNILVVDPAHRYTASEIASHPWTTGSTDPNTSIPTNVLALMKDYAKQMADDKNETNMGDEKTSNEQVQGTSLLCNQLGTGNNLGLTLLPDTRKSSSPSSKGQATKKGPLVNQLRKDPIKPSSAISTKLTNRSPIQSVKRLENTLTPPHPEVTRQRSKSLLSGNPSNVSIRSVKSNPNDNGSSAPKTKENEKPRVPKTNTAAKNQKR